LTSFIYKNCTVSDVMAMANPGYRFNILNERAQTVLSLAFERKDDAEHARIEAAKAVEKAAEVTRPALTAAGEP
jgi:hypothetical protein